MTHSKPKYEQKYKIRLEWNGCTILNGYNGCSLCHSINQFTILVEAQQDLTLAAVCFDLMLDFPHMRWQYLQLILFVSVWNMVKCSQTLTHLMGTLTEELDHFKSISSVVSIKRLVARIIFFIKRFFCCPLSRVP